MKKLILFFVIVISTLTVMAENSHKIKELEANLRYCVSEKNWQETIEKADELLKYKPRSAKAHYEKAEALMGIDKYQDALVHYDLALKYKYRPLSSLYVSRGLCLESLNRLEEALKSFNLYIKNNTDTYFYVGCMRYRVKRKLGRINICNFEPVYPTIKGLVPEPELKAKLWYSIAEDKPEETIAAADEIMKNHPRNDDAVFEKARALTKLGRNQEAMEYYDLALKHGYDYRDFLYYERGLCLEKSGKLEEALESYRLSAKEGGRLYYKRCLRSVGKLEGTANCIISEGVRCINNWQVFDDIDRVLLKLSRYPESDFNQNPFNKIKS